MNIEAVIFDLDGVIRHYDRAHERDIEVRHGLSKGSLIRTAFGGELGTSFMCGHIDHPEFTDRLGVDLCNAEAAAEFVSMRPVVDNEAVALATYLQSHVKVALLTNGSTRTRQELLMAGLEPAFPQVFNSAESGIPKPHSEAYLRVIRSLEVAPERTVFVDDHLPNVQGAEAVGIWGHHYTNLDELRGFLTMIGIELSS